MKRRRAHLKLRARLEARQSELEQALLTQAQSVAAFTAIVGVDDNAGGLRTAISEALAYGLEGVSPDDEVSIPPAFLLARARRAARQGVNLSVLLRRYFAGYTILSNLLIEEAETSALLTGDELRQLLQAQSIRLDALLSTISEEYSREAAAQPSTSGQRRIEYVRRLLNGEFLDPKPLGLELTYDFNIWHLGMVGEGAGVVEQLRKSLSALDVQSLVVCPHDEAVWAWLGSRRSPDLSAVHLRLHQMLSSRQLLAIGEPSRGINGWRLTHHQAVSAASVARSNLGSPVLYSEVALLAAIFQNGVLSASLRQRYLDPLVADRDGGDILRSTLLAYFAAGRNVSSAAAALRVSRQTVGNRLRVVEGRIGDSLSNCSVELELALRLDDALRKGGGGQQHY